MVTIGFDSVVAAFFGAFFSGLIGVLLFEYKNKRDSYEQQREWYNNIIRICNNIETTTPNIPAEDSETTLSDKQADQKKHAKHVYAFVYQSLVEQISSPPRTVSSELMGEIDELSKTCFLSIEEHQSPVPPSMSQIGQTPTYDMFEDYHSDVLSKAENVREKAKQERDDIGIW